MGQAMSSSTVSCLAADDDSEDTMDFSYEKMKTEPKAKERAPKLLSLFHRTKKSQAVSDPDVLFIKRTVSNEGIEVQTTSSGNSLDNPTYTDEEININLNESNMEYFDERVIITEESSSYLQAIAEVPELSEELDLTIVG